MSRDLNSEVVTALESDVVRPITMVHLDLGSSVIAVHSGLGTFSYGGVDYVGVGNLGAITEMMEAQSVAPTGVKMTLSGISPEYVSLMVGQHYQGRPATIYIGLLDASHQLIADPILGFKGKVDYADIKMGENATITLSAESRLVDWSRARVARYTHEDQQAKFPGDMGPEFVAKMVDIPILWGVSG